jgi:hypothetical protein
VRNDNFLRIFLLLTLCTGYLVSFSHLGVFAYERFFGSGGSYADGTMLGSIPAAGVPDASLSQQLAADIEIWQTTNTITVRYKEKAEALPTEIFSFNVEDSVLGIESGQRNPVSVQVDDELFNQFLRYFASAEELNKLDKVQLKEDLYRQAAFLGKNESDYRLEAYMDAEKAEQAVIAQSVAANEEVTNEDLALWVQKLKTIEIGPNQQVSLLEAADKAGLLNLSNELLSLVGSSIYQTIANSNFDVLERHISRRLPEGIEPGFEARVVQKKQDLVFFNPNFTPYVLKFELANGGLKTTLQGEPLFYQYEAIAKDIEKFEPKTIVQYNAAFPPNVRNIEEIGEEGMVVKVYRNKMGDEGSVESSLLAEDFYPPVHMIEQRGFKVEEKESLSSTAEENTESGGTTSNGSESISIDENTSPSNEQTPPSSEPDGEKTTDSPAGTAASEKEPLRKP